MGNTKKQWETPFSEATKKIRDTLTGNKWWTVQELSSYLNMQQMSVYTCMSRNNRKLNIKSYEDKLGGKRVKYYRINQDATD